MSKETQEVQDKKEFKYTCPICHKGFDKAEGKRCPHCNGAIKSRRIKPTGEKQFKYVYEIDYDRVEKKGEEKEPEEKWEYITDKAEMSAIRQKVGTPNDKQEFIVEYHGVIYTGWLYCPGCWTKLSQNTMVQTTSLFENQTKCKKCGSLVTFSFSTGTYPSW